MEKGNGNCIGLFREERNEVDIQRVSLLLDWENELRKAVYVPFAFTPVIIVSNFSFGLIIYVSKLIKFIHPMLLCLGYPLVSDAEPFYLLEHSHKSDEEFVNASKASEMRIAHCVGY